MMSETDGAVERLRAAAAGFRRFQPAIEAGRPWPLHVVEHDAGPESEWGPTEVLAHVTEMLPFWLGEIERICDGDPEPVPFAAKLPSEAERFSLSTVNLIASAAARVRR